MPRVVFALPWWLWPVAFMAWLGVWLLIIGAAVCVAAVIIVGWLIRAAVVYAARWYEPRGPA